MTKKKIGLIIFTLLTIALFVLASQYVASYLLMEKIKASNNPIHFKQIFSFWDYFLHVKKINPNFKIVKSIFFIPMLSMVGIASSPILMFILVLVGLYKKEELYGSARLANDMDLSRSGLFPTPSQLKQSKYPAVLIGKMHKGRYKNKFLQFTGQQFLYIAAPTRSGKGVGVVIPNLLNYTESLVILDIKLENFIFTGGWRKSQGQEVFLFCPDGYAISYEDFEKMKQTDDFLKLAENEQEDLIIKFQNGELLRSHRYNPLTYINRNLNFRESDIMVIAKILYPNTGGENDMWNELACNLFKGLVLYMLDLEASDIKNGNDEVYPVNMANLLKLTAPQGGLQKFMQIETTDKVDILSDGCKAEFQRFIATPERTQGSILSNLTAPLSIFSSATCQYATSGDDFDLRDVRKKKISIYLGLAPTSLSTYARLVNLFFSQLVSVNTKELPDQNPELKYQCLLMLDEFTSMGKVEIIQKSIAYTAGYNIRYMIIIQNKGQIEDSKLYGKEGAESLMDNCAVHLIYPPKKVNEDAKAISETIGQKTVTSHIRNTSRSKGGSTVSDNASIHGRDVMLPQEVVDLGNETYVTSKGNRIDLGINEIVIMEKVKPFVAHKIVYFDEPIFAERKSFSEKNIVSIPFIKFNNN